MTSRRKPKPEKESVGPTNQSDAGKRLVKRRGKGYMSEIAQRGGEATAAKYGPDYFREIGKRGIDKRQAIYDAGKRALEGDAKK